MAQYRVRDPQGVEHLIEGPDGATPEEVLAQAQRLVPAATPNHAGMSHDFSATQDKPPLTLPQFAGNLAAGAARGAGGIGATILGGAQAAFPSQGQAPVSALDARAKIVGRVDDSLAELGADKTSAPFRGAKLGAEMAGTAGIGGLIGKGLQALPIGAPAFVQAVQSGGMKAGQAGPGALNALRNLAVRGAGGAVTGGAAAGAIDPESAGAGMALGGALPLVTKVGGAVGSSIGSALRGSPASPSVVALADRAKALGIQIPADRLMNSRPLNAVAASLNYMPFSGRAATEQKMVEQLNAALSRTFGQKSSNVAQALEVAAGDLGGKFDAVLQSNTVKMTPAFKTALADAETQANSELGNEAASVIRKQIALIQTKGASGEIDGQTAYNIKKALDRIGRGSSDAAFYARGLKKSLMDALNESLGPQEARAFAKVRQQYGNMLALEGMAQNGAEGGVSVARLANKKNLSNPDLQELADISAQFLKSRESAHGAMQRVTLGGLAAGGGMAGMAAPIATGIIAGRATNSMLNSDFARALALHPPKLNALTRVVTDPRLVQLGYRVAPTLPAQ